MPEQGGKIGSGWRGQMCSVLFPQVLGSACLLLYAPAEVNYKRPLEVHLFPQAVAFAAFIQFTNSIWL